MMLNGQPAPPRNPIERELEKVQRKISAALVLEERRRELIVQLHRQGMSQVEIAARLSRAAMAEGCSPITDDHVFKIIRAHRMSRHGER